MSLPEPKLERPPAQPSNGSASPGTSIGVFIVVGDQSIFRRGLRSTIADDPGFVCLGEAADATEALRGVEALKPDVVVLDAASLGPADAAVLQSLPHRAPRSRLVVMVPPSGGAESLRHWTAGATCVLSRAASASQLVDAIRGATGDAGRRARTVPPARTARLGPSPVGHDLTPRERSLLALMSEGLSNPDIAARLEISVATVKYHVQHILAKLGADNRTCAVLVALRHKLVE